MTAPPRQPLIRLVPIPGQRWTADDRETAGQILDWMRDGFSVIGYQASGEPGNGPENTHARRYAVDALSAAYRELGWLLDRIATVETGVEDGPLPEAPKW